MRAERFSGLLAGAALLASCGGGDGGSSGSGVTGGSTATTPTPTPSATPTPTAAAGCSLRERQDWAFVQLNEWYLFPETLPASLNPSGYSTVDDYIDALTATARAQRKDRFFTYLTSIAEENAYYNAGTTNGGFGIRLGYDTTNRRVGIIEAFEGAPALAAGLDRGTEILSIGTSTGTLRTTSDLIASAGPQGVIDALGPDTAGTTRVLRVSDDAGTRNVTLTKADFTLTPVSSRYGAKIITDNGMRVGYVNLRTFINTADAGLRSAFQQFRDAGVTNIVVDVRYNGGGSLSIAQLFTDLLGGARSNNDVQSYIAFRASKSSQNETTFFSAQPQAISPTRIAFIGTGNTASASEYVINSLLPYMRGNVALIGSNTFGKPVGQIALDRTQCDDRLRVVALALQNAARQGDYYDGLATKVETSCQAVDDSTYQLGDPREASTRAALNFLQGRGCTRIGTTASATRAATPFAQGRELLSPARPSTAQRETPGLF